MSINKRLKEARCACGLSQQEVTDALGLVRSTLVRWETGDKPPKESDIRVLAEIYRTDIGWVLTGEPKEEQPLRSLKRKQESKQVLANMVRTAKFSKPVQVGGSAPSSVTPKAISDFESQQKMGLREGSPGPSAKDLADHLARISERIQWLLNSRPVLPVIPGIQPVLMEAMREGTVIPNPELILALAEKTLVHPSWIMKGDDSFAYFEPKTTTQDSSVDQ
jgi:transcriptional regulator with XRE-family HTH domain